MKTLVVIALMVLTGCPHTLSETDRAALQDFRTVERACLARAEAILRDDGMGLSDPSELIESIERDLVTPWRAMRARVNLRERTLGEDLTGVLGRYFDERELAWTSLGKAIARDRFNAEATVNHHWQYRESDEAATKDKAILDARFAALKLPPLPAMEAPLVVELSPPPPSATPGAAYFLAGRSIVRLDTSGFRTIASDVDVMDVLPDGTMWACSASRLVRWDGTRSAEYKPPLAVTTCAAAPDGSVWVLEERYRDRLVDRLGRFDGATWTIRNAAIGDVETSATGMLVDREGHLYVRTETSGTNDAVFVLDNRVWRRVPLQGAAEGTYVNHLLRGDDGQIWATYQLNKTGGYEGGVARLTPSGGEAPTNLTDFFPQQQVYPVVDASGVVTVLDSQRNSVAQARRVRKLHLPVPHDGWDRDNRGPFAFDGAGRMWLDLTDGINVVEKGGKTTVYPRGSVDGIRQNIKTIVVTGAGPALPPPGPVVTRTITGKLREEIKLDLVLCGDGGYSECPRGLPSWTTTSDAEGNFRFDDVPRWTLSMRGLTGPSSNRVWRPLEIACCAEQTELGELWFRNDVIY